MAFQTEAGQIIKIDDEDYKILEHPYAPGMPYGQEGRQAIVYSLERLSRLVSTPGNNGVKNYALKVFKPRFRLPALVSLAEKISAYGEMPGLAVCHRTVLSARKHSDLLRQHPDLTYAVLMPWIKGPTWFEVLLDKRELTFEQCLSLTRSFLETLVMMEEKGIAHCDLSGPNVLLPALDAEFDSSRSLPAVALVDVEQMYGPGLEIPRALPGGSPGYAHHTSQNGLWCANADRFAGAVLLAEMLCICDKRVREAMWGENYFDPGEMQQDTERYQVLAGVLSERWGKDLEETFIRAWQSDSLAACPTFGEWLVRLPGTEPSPNNMLMAVKDGKEADNCLLMAGKDEQPGPVLKIVREGYEETISIDKPEFILGRKKDAVDYCIEDNKYIGRIHAKLVLDKGNCSVIDLKSKNGTLLNGERLISHRPYPLVPGDKVTLANVEFVYFKEEILSLKRNKGI
jgi:hypothetical protein